MERINKIVTATSPTVEYKYLVFCDKGAIVYNSRLGVLYKNNNVEACYKDFVSKYGAFAVEDPDKFYKLHVLVRKFDSVKLNEEKSQLEYNFSDGKGIVVLSIILNAEESLPQLRINWPDSSSNEFLQNSIPITHEWHDVDSVISSKAEDLYGKVLGIYAKDGFLYSFDNVSGLKSIADQKIPDFFCPIGALNLGLYDLQRLYVNEKDNVVFLVGDDIMYVCTTQDKSDKLSNVVEFFKFSRDISEYIVNITCDSDIWKRIKAFDNIAAVSKLVINDGKVFVDSWAFREIIGETDMPNIIFENVSIKLLKGWAKSKIAKIIGVYKSQGVLYNLQWVTPNGLLVVSGVKKSSSKNVFINDGKVDNGENKRPHYNEEKLL